MNNLPAFSSQPARTSLFSWGVYAYAAFAAVSVLFTVYCILLGYHIGPYRDMWIAMDFIRQVDTEGLSWSNLFSLHGEAHRLVIPRLLFLLEYQVFSGSNYFLIAVSMAVQVSVVFLVWRLLSLHPALPQQHKLFLLAMAVVLMFNPTQLENFLYTFDTQWFLTTAAALWGLTCWVKYLSLADSRTPVVWCWLSAAIVFSLVSVFSSFTGICVLLVLPLLVWCMQRNWKALCVSLVVVSVVILLYLQGPFSQASNWIGIKDEVVTPWIVLKFSFYLIQLLLKWIALYLGSPLSREWYWPAAIITWLSLIYLGFILYRAIRYGMGEYSASQIVFLFVAVFAAVAGFATGWGRMYFINTANEDRYQSVVLMYWLGIFGFAYLHSLKKSLKLSLIYRYGVVALIIFWTACVIPLYGLKDARAQINFFDKVNTGNLALATGQWEFHAIKQTLILGDKTKRINRPEMHADFLRDKGWGIFATEPYEQLGRPLALPADGGEADYCQGYIRHAKAVGGGYGGYRLRGQAWDLRYNKAFQQLVITDDQTRVIGLGRLLRQTDSLRPVSYQAGESARWWGYTMDLPDSAILMLWARRDNGDYCWIETRRLSSLLAESATKPAKPAKKSAK